MSGAPLTYAIHIRRGGNIGDMVSTPADYFTFQGEVRRLDVRKFMRSPPKAKPDFVIAGGGAWKKVLGQLKRHPLLAGVPKVAWGVGVTSRKLGPMPKCSHTRRAKGWNLYAHRDVGLRGRYLPCASCMHPAFDKPYTVQHEVVYYGHGPLAPLNFAKGIGPHMTNITDSLEEVLEFLGSGDVVVTSSYHGAYWARLLGRRVALLPRGSKFWHLPSAPPPNKPHLPGLLRGHRELNRKFHAEVLGMMERAG